MVLNIFLEAAARSIKNIEMFLEAATYKKISAAHFLSEAVVHGVCSKIYSEAAAQVLTVSSLHEKHL